MDPINRLMQTLRQRIADSPSASAKSSSAERNCTHASADRPSVHELKVYVQERIRAIAPSGPEDKRIARRIFLEAVIAWEFGEALLLDSRLQGTIDDIEKTFDAAPELGRKFDVVLEQLAQR